MNTPEEQNGDAQQGPYSELSLEREKLQIERERLALERERWETERASYGTARKLSDHAAGKTTLPISTLVLSIVSAALLGGLAGLWGGIAYTRPNGNSDELAASIANAFNESDGTNSLHTTSNPLIRALRNKNGSNGGALMILY